MESQSPLAELLFTTSHEVPSIEELADDMGELKAYCAAQNQKLAMLAGDLEVEKSPRHGCHERRLYVFIWL